MTIPEAQKRRGELCNEINELSEKNDPTNNDLLIAKQKEAEDLWEFINKEQ